MPKLIVICSAAFVLVLAPLLALAGAPAPRFGVPALLVGPPWESATQIAQAARVNALLSAQSPMGAFVVVHTRDDVTRLFDNGAWFVIDGQRIAEFCAT